MFLGSPSGRQLYSSLKHLLGGKSSLWPRSAVDRTVSSDSRALTDAATRAWVPRAAPRGRGAASWRVPLRPSGPDAAPLSPVNFEALIIAMSVIGGSFLLAVAMCCCCCCCGRKRSRKPDRSEEKVMREQEERRIRQEER